MAGDFRSYVAFLVDFLSGDFMAGDFMSYVAQIGDFMSGDFMSGDFLTWIPQPESFNIPLNVFLFLAKTCNKCLTERYIDESHLDLVK